MNICRIIYFYYLYFIFIYIFKFWYKKYKYMFLGRATEEFRILLLSHMLCACKTKG
ncbi:hypothetical protein GHT06_006752 [Daphnia sinensis]|uniref:Uncharacterized protein n=1 Tax=Daphnia sinensis TaxID=1820382 RepID=A0AAD5PN81_9CRUS|nr:hypothetical protein GHT06_006752 [Daphnia sinensis]